MNTHTYLVVWEVPVIMPGQAAHQSTQRKNALNEPACRLIYIGGSSNGKDILGKICGRWLMGMVTELRLPVTD